MMAYERLHAWRASHELAVAVYRVTRAFPHAERYGLTSQLRRAAFSVSANIAEGVAKRGSAEFRRFLDIAVGSLSEVSCGLLLARDVGILSTEQRDDLEKLRVRAAKLTWGLYAKIALRARRPGA